MSTTNASQFAQALYLLKNLSGYKYVSHLQRIISVSGSINSDLAACAITVQKDGAGFLYSF